VASNEGMARRLLRDRVKRGAALLDRKVPGWANKLGAKIFNGQFDMGDWGHCVVGSLELVHFEFDNSRTRVPTIVLNGESLVGNDKAAENGFYPTATRSARSLQILEELWRKEVDKRGGFPSGTEKK
jgi:hypothetical protein